MLNQLLAEAAENAPWCDCAKCTSWHGAGCPCCTGCLYVADDYLFMPSVSAVEMAKQRRAEGKKPYYPNSIVKGSFCTIL